MSQLKIIGTNTTRPDAYDKVTGGKHYPVNFSRPGMLHAKILRSPLPHARIKILDTAPALSVPGNTYQCQAWGRDPGFPAPNNTTLSDALDVTVGP